MVRDIKASNFISIPEAVEVDIKKRVVTIKGTRGELVRSFDHVPIDLKYDPKQRRVTGDVWFGKKSDAATIKTVLSQVDNMITGVMKGFRYKMRFAYAHFPISVSVEGSDVTIRHFLGEKYTRKVPILGNTKVFRTETSVCKDELVLEGESIQDVSQTAAAVHGACLVKKKDIRKFLDGVYVSSKANILQD